MDKDRIAGSAKEVIGGLKESAGKATGDAKLQADGKAKKSEGKASAKKPAAKKPAAKKAAAKKPAKTAKETA